MAEPPPQEEPIKILAFARLCLNEALRTSADKADWMVLIFGAIVGPIALLVPQWETSVTLLLFIAPISALASVIIFRVFLSPLLVYRKLEAVSRDTESHLREAITTHEQTINERDQEIHALLDKSKRTPAEQHDYDTAKECLRILGQTGIDALRFLRKRGTLSFNSSGGCTAELPAELKLQNALWAYRHCASEGVVVCNSNLGATASTYSISPKMETILEELLFQDKGLSGLADVRRK